MTTDTYQDELKHQKARVKWVIDGLDFENLTDWEEKYMESVERQTNCGKWLSDKQMEIMERIYREKGYK